MTFLKRWAAWPLVALACACASPAFAIQQQDNPLAVSQIPIPANTGSGTQTAGGTAQALFGGVTPVDGWKVLNLGASDCYASDETTTPSLTTPGSEIVFANGGQYSTEPGEKPLGPVYLNCPTTGQAFTARRW